MDHVREMQCIKSTEYSIHTRRCFITGEYCSQQANVQKARRKLHSESEINAFVIMNFSSMSDIMYVSRIKPFIEGLKKYLFIDSENHRIACYSNPSKQHIDPGFKAVKTIHVHRADSNPVSNNIICNRICQLIQIADLAIVDVSVESANVFYELGLATAFNKLILPICFSESFYEMKLPDKLDEAIKKQQEKQITAKGETDFESPTKEAEEDPALKKLEKHIDCYPWRRKLFEHFGIRHQNFVDGQSGCYSGVRYFEPYIVFSEKYGFSDYQYNHFPYDAPMDKNTEKDDETNPSVGKTIYDWLQSSYNQAPSYCYNTLVLYTMDRILNKNQAGQCIVNFYRNITKPMIDKHCFCGDRVAILGQSNIIWDDPKDSKTNKELFYGVSDIIQIGMDEATYRAERRRIKTNDYMFCASDNSYAEKCGKDAKEAVDQLIKTHIRNRCIPLNPETPIYVTQLQDGIQQNLKEHVVDKIKEQNKPAENEFHFFCLYHVMLDTLRYVNELVVDLSSNSIQAMFWLGAAHGANIQAITVRHEMSEKEKVWSKSSNDQTDRPVFDISGLWTAMLRYNETESFYKQLALIQQGIEQRTKLMLPDTELEMLEEDVFKQFYSPSRFPKKESLSEMLQSNSTDSPPDKAREDDENNKVPYTQQLMKKHDAESHALESYYRDIFWRHMLRDNQLHLFLPMSDANETEGPRLQVIKWDVDAVAELSNYLSKRKVIGKYQFDTLRPNEHYTKDNKAAAKSENFICIGEQTKPLYDDKSGKAISLAERINHVVSSTYNVRCLRKWFDIHAFENSLHRPVQYRGFCTSSDEQDPEIRKRFYTSECCTCSERNLSCKPNQSPSIDNMEKSDIALPEQIVLSRLSRSSGDDNIQYTATFMPSTKTLTSFCLRFGISHNAKTIAAVHCMPVTKYHSYTEISSENQRADNNCILSNALSTILPNEIVLKHDPSISSMLNGYYAVQCSSEIPQWLLCSILSKFELHLNGTEENAILYEIDLNKQDASTEGKSPVDKSDLKFAIPGQLLLWREKQEHTNEDDREFKYHVSLVGASGPATKALTALLVDSEQKKRILNCTSSINKYYPLDKLQTYIRNQFFEKLENRLKAELENSPNSAPIIYLTVCYLSTILYQYFLPFLSHADEKRIYNALEAFLLTVDSKDDDTLEQLIKNHSQKILDILKEFLESFQGIEAMYSVNLTATFNSNTTDNRKITGIGEFKKDESPVVSCLFINPS